MSVTEPHAERSRQPATPSHPGGLRLRRLGIHTHQEAVLYMRTDCSVCRSEGFSTHARVAVSANGRTLIATLNHVDGELLAHGEASLSEWAWTRLGAAEGQSIELRHAPRLESLSAVRGKVFGKRLGVTALRRIIADVVHGHYSDIHLAAFITACASQELDSSELIALTAGMVDAGERLDWGRTPIADKHCVGGLPGNRTTPIVVAILAALGLTIPKTSSRAITSPSGTADTMEVLAPVDLSLDAMRRVVEQEGGCVVWGGAVQLSPADDVLIRVERALDLDAEAQLVASVISKKVAAGATHLVLDIPVGATAKVRDQAVADKLRARLGQTAAVFNMQTRVVISDGTQPVGCGIGPALEAREVLAVLRNERAAPAELRARAVALAGALLELCGHAPPGAGESVAERALADGHAAHKFEAICEAQGGMRKPPTATDIRPIAAPHPGRVTAIDNRKISRLAKLAGAPHAKAAGILLHTSVGAWVETGQALFSVHAESRGELDYALDYLAVNRDVVEVSADG